MSATSTTPAPEQPAPLPAICSLEEMAALLNISLPTMRARTRHPDFPILRRGSNGTPWQLDPAAVIAHLAEQDRRAQEAEAARAAALSQFALPIAEPQGAEPLASISPADRLKIAQAASKEDELARQRGFLVQTHEMRARVTDAFAPLAAFLNALPGTLGRRHNLPDPVIRDMRTLIDTQRRALVERLGTLLDPATAEPDAAAESAPDAPRFAA